MFRALSRLITGVFLLTYALCSLAVAQAGSTALITVSGSGFDVKTLKEGAVAYINRDYVWRDVPQSLVDWEFTELSGGVKAKISVIALSDGDLYAASIDTLDKDGWLPVEGLTLTYNDRNHTTLQIYRLHVTANSTLKVPQHGWAGSIVLAPRLTSEHAAAESEAIPPGRVIDFQPDQARQFVGSPSIAVLPNGTYVASHDVYGAGARGDDTLIFRSTNKGGSWQQMAHLEGQYWSSLFVHGGALYIIGANESFGQIVIRRSDNDGASWTTPKDAQTGLLSQLDGMHCAATPVLEFNGRLWRAFERRSADARKAKFQAFMISAPVGANLLRASSWSGTNLLAYASPEQAGNWLEGNAVPAPDGSILDVIRIDSDGPQRAAVLSVSTDGKRIAWNSTSDLIDVGGATGKFTIRYDPVSRRYWTLVDKQRFPKPKQNALALASSSDLAHWTVETTLLDQPDRDRHSFQYLDWQFDGADIVAVSRTSWNGDKNRNPNYLTFHRILNFRSPERIMSQ
jgi:hypothetical protein